VPVPVGRLDGVRSGFRPVLPGIRSQVASVWRLKVVPDSQMRVWKCEFWESMWTSTVPILVLLVLMEQKSGRPSLRHWEVKRQEPGQRSESTSPLQSLMEKYIRPSEARAENRVGRGVTSVKGTDVSALTKLPSEESYAK
jgi:hypothetical protein